MSARCSARAFALVALLAAACAAPLAPSTATRQERDHQAALEAWERAPDDEMTNVWLGRRLGYLGRYEEAVAAFTRGLAAHPDSAWLLRFRGHRYITLRRFADAVRDLERARELAALRPDEVEPDGAPNAAGIPIGTLRSNVDYHLGLAWFLLGDFERAWRVYEDGFELARANDDRLVSHTYWAYLTLSKLGRRAEARELLAPIRRDMHILENESYLALLLHFRGDLTESELLSAPSSGANDAATRGFGVALARSFAGDAAGARARLAEVVRKGPPAAFGTIAAEAELTR